MGLMRRSASAVPECCGIRGANSDDHHLKLDCRDYSQLTVLHKSRRNQPRRHDLQRCERHYGEFRGLDDLELWQHRSAVRSGSLPVRGRQRHQLQLRLDQRVYRDLRLQALTVVNYGNIAGPLGGGIILNSGGSVNNAATASVILGLDGVEINGSAGTVVNDGSITGTGTTGLGFGVALLAGGSVTNAASASITGAVDGIDIQGGAGTVVNNSNITGAGSGVGYAGVVLAAGGAVINAATTASITGATYGVDIYGGGTLTNAGTVVGNTGTAVVFGGTGSNLLLLDPGYGLFGLAMGSTSAINTLELASAASTGTLSGLGTEFVDFVQTTIDADASWVFNGANTIEAGTTLTEHSAVRR